MKDKSTGPLTIGFFGTYDESTHPRVRVLRQGFLSRGFALKTYNIPLGVSTANRVSMAKRPWEAPRLLLRIISAWVQLVRLRISQGSVDVVIVGYMGQFDIHLARLLFPRAKLVIDFMVGLGDTARDRGVAKLVATVLQLVDNAALHQADIVACDTVEQQSVLPGFARERSVVAPVGAPQEWLDAGTAAKAKQQPSDRPLSIVFFGLYTPLQGSITIAQALAAALNRGAPIRATLIGTGQDYEAVHSILQAFDAVEFIDWVDSADLPAVVASHDVTLGIFGTTPKAFRVVPNKVYQGLAAGTIVVTSDTPCQREMLDGSGILVPPGDSESLAAVLWSLATETLGTNDSNSSYQATALATAATWGPSQVVGPLVNAISDTE